MRSQERGSITIKMLELKIAARLVDTISTLAMKANYSYQCRGGAESSRICLMLSAVLNKM